MSRERTGLKSLEIARDLICEAKGFEPNGGSVTDHLDAAEGWLDDAQKDLEEMPHLQAIEKELWRLSLVIESAVRNADPQNRPDVLNLLKMVRRPDPPTGGRMDE